jgi:hypothetical protein
MIAGGGIGTIAIALIGYFVFGIDPNTTQQVISQFGGAGAQELHISAIFSLWILFGRPYVGLLCVNRHDRSGF